jgi:hypothetical protein
LQRWQEESVWLNAWQKLLGTLDERVLLEWVENFLDGSFAPAKEEAPQSAKPSAAREQMVCERSKVKVSRWEFGWKVPLRVKFDL